MEKQRVYYWDNLKALLIFLVVLGHFLLPVTDIGRVIEVSYFFIYIFHMPAFVFVTGYFAKYYMKKQVPQINKLLGFLILYVVYKVLLWITKSIVVGELVKFDLLEERAAPWYMLCMFYWYVLLPIFDKFKPQVSIGFAVLLALMAGLDPRIGFFLCLCRCIVYMPFFLIGYYFKSDWLEKITTRKAKIVAGIFLAVVLVILAFNMKFMDKYGAIIFGSSGYSVIHTSDIVAMGLRFLWMLIASAITLAIMCLIPKRKTVITFIGSRTLAIYILHRIIRQIFENGYLYRYFDDNEIVVLVICIVISVIITLVCSAKCFTDLFQKAFEIKYDVLLNKKKHV